MLLPFALCGVFGFAVSASSAEMTVSNLYTTDEGYNFDVRLDAQSVSGYIFVARKNAAGAFAGVQVYDAAAKVEVEVSNEYASATVFWWDVFNTMKPMVRQTEIDFKTVPEKPILNDIEDAGLL